MLTANSFALYLQSVFQPGTLADLRIDFEEYLTESGRDPKVQLWLKH